MKIGDRVFVRGYIDEIRKDTVIIRNAGGYFGTIPSEVITGALPPAQPRKGKWIDYSDEGYVECPFCHSATNCDDNKDELHYCFSCGAELR